MATSTVSEDLGTASSTSVLSLAGDALRLAAASLLSSGEREPGRRTVSLQEVSWHDNDQDCWVVVQDLVYDVTPLLDTHPGGREVLLEHAGRDATQAFQGFPHPPAVLDLVLNNYCVGVLPAHQRIYDDAGRLSGITLRKNKAGMGVSS